MKKTALILLLITLFSASLFATESWNQLGFGVAEYDGIFVEQVEGSNQFNSKKTPIGIGDYFAFGTKIGSLNALKASVYANVGLATDFGTDCFYTSLMVGPGVEIMLHDEEGHLDLSLGAFLTAEYCINDSLAIYLSGSYVHAMMDVESGAMFPDRAGFNAGIGFAISFSSWEKNKPSLFIPY